jgi:hypothetical protein
MGARSTAGSHAWLLGLWALALAAGADERRNWFNDPFARATSGYAQCPQPDGPLLTQQEMRQQAHVRVERGTSCALEGKCEPGGAYKHDPEINERVRQAIGAERKLRSTSIWVTTQAGYVTLDGCVRAPHQKSRLNALVGRQPGVRYVVDRTTLGIAPRSATKQPR